jgi:hypothetical protein
MEGGEGRLSERSLFRVPPLTASGFNSSYDLDSVGISIVTARPVPEADCA